ncbi:CDC27 family protein [Helicobacter sp. 11S03491-1]|uniref:tetratricopeptide repeat protein n=1 Tax=Helicobacter sp. 11S03491-1 TaxID=1476196 RepID=UPI000BA7CB82|nr:CDC27 family protein [Helicobacter sp. 11S03491-1]PAF43367.1 hypothetical protein BKH45_01630 [Helicobacter sp. 11S03491-1]
MKNLIKKKILFFAFSVILPLILSGCFSKNQDFFGDEVYRERVLLAAKNYKDLIKMFKQKLEKKDTPQTRIKLAQYYFKSKDYNSVFYYLRPLIKDKKSTQATMLWAQTLQTTNKYQDALAILDDLIKTDKNIPQAYNLRGIIYASEKKFDLAKKDFLDAKKLFLSDMIINTNLGMIEILQQNYAEAINYLMPLYMRGYKDPKILNNLILALVKSDKLNAALEIVQKENLSKSPRKFLRNLQKIKANSNEKKSL